MSSLSKTDPIANLPALVFIGVLVVIGARLATLWAITPGEDNSDGECQRGLYLDDEGGCTWKEPREED